MGVGFFEALHQSSPAEGKEKKKGFIIRFLKPDTHRSLSVLIALNFRQPREVFL